MARGGHRFPRAARGVLAALALALASPAAADEGADNAAGLAALKEPGAVAIMRHALAPGRGDPAEVVVVEDCATQRNLDDRGREQARRIGETLKEAGIAFDRVLTGAWCRVKDTARLLDLGEPEHFAPLDDVFHRLEKRDEKVAALRAYLAALPDEERVLMVTHQLNLTGLTGLPAHSGEILVIDVDGAGGVSVLGHILVPPPGGFPEG